MSFNQGIPGPATLINSSSTLLYGNTSSGNALSVQQLGAGNVASFRTTTGSTALFVGANGNVGVGTTNPATALDVFTGTMNAATVVATTHYGAIAGSNTVSASTVTGGTSVSAPTVVGSTALYGVLAGSNTVSASTVSGTTITASSQFSGPGTGLTGSAASLTAGLAQGLTGTPAITVGTVSGTTITASSSFSGPGTNLTGSAASLSVGGSAGSLSTTYAAGRILYGAGSGVPTTVSTLFYDSANGRVGIGTTSPGSALHAAISSATATTIATFENYNTTTTTAKSFKLQFYGNGAGGQKDLGSINIIPTDVNFGYNDMAFSIRGPFGAGSSEAVSEVMRFSRSGVTPCVGIGTGSPSTALTVYTTTPAHGIRHTDGTVTVETYIGSSAGWLGTFSNHPLKLFTNNQVEAMTIGTNNNVGIGTTNPGFPLHVMGAGSATSTFKYISYAGVPNWTSITGAFTITLGIYAALPIGSSDSFVLFSDERIKTKEQSIDYLNVINQINPVTFSYIDKIRYGDQKRVGFYAQEVEKVLPDAVAKTKDFIPDIFKTCDTDGGHRVNVPGHALSEGAVIKIMSGETTKECIIKTVDGDWIEVDETLDNTVFVYGKKVDDFRVLNYDYMASVGFGGLKELHALVNTQQTTIEMLTERLAALEAKLNSQ